jgi:hypothetical protein
VHFTLLGAAIFVGHGWLRGGPAGQDGQAIVVTDRFVEGLAAHHGRRTGEVPDQAMLDALVDDFVRLEVLYREAKRLGLDRGDPIVRQRMVQKMEFLLEGTADIPEPTEDDLRAHLSAHADRYRRPPRVAFDHVFFSRDRRGPDAEADAARALQDLQDDHTAEAPAGLGDPFLAGLQISLRPLGRVAGSFGQPFADAIADLPDGEWAGPVPSAHGFHLVRVTERVPGKNANLDEVRPRVRAEWVEARRAEAVARATRELLEAYPVERVQDRPAQRPVAAGQAP